LLLAVGGGHHGHGHVGVRALIAALIGAFATGALLAMAIGDQALRASMRLCAWVARRWYGEHERRLVELEGKLAELVVGQFADHLCWIDAMRALSQHLGLPWRAAELPRRQFENNCRRFAACVYGQTPYGTDAATREIERLRSALRPFAAEGAHVPTNLPDDFATSLPVGWCREAAKLVGVRRSAFGEGVVELRYRVAGFDLASLELLVPRLERVARFCAPSSDVSLESLADLLRDLDDARARARA
jgi:hypothetical protein